MVTRISVEDLARIRERERSRMVLRSDHYRGKITVHMGTCGIAAGARDVMARLQDLIGQLHLHDIILTSSGCAGLCAKEPMITVEVAGQPPVKYIELDTAKVQRIFEEHVIGGNPVEDCALARGCEATAV